MCLRRGPCSLSTAVPTVGLATRLLLRGGGGQQRDVGGHQAHRDCGNNKDALYRHVADPKSEFSGLTGTNSGGQWLDVWGSALECILNGICSIHSCRIRFEARLPPPNAALRAHHTLLMIRATHAKASRT